MKMAWKFYLFIWMKWNACVQWNALFSTDHTSFKPRIFYFACERIDIREKRNEKKYNYDWYSICACMWMCATVWILARMLLYTQSLTRNTNVSNVSDLLTVGGVNNVSCFDIVFVWKCIVCSYRNRVFLCFRVELTLNDAMKFKWFYRPIACILTEFFVIHLHFNQ